MKHITTKFQKLSTPAAVLVSLGAALVLALVLEIGVFQFSYFTQGSGSYAETTLDLSGVEGWNGEALALLPENPSVSLDGFSLPVRSATITTAGPAKVLTGTLGICDAASPVKTAGAGTFTVNPGGRENTATVRIQSRGDLTRLRLTFEELNEPVFLISVTLNARQPLAIHWLRVFLMTGLLAALFLALRFRLYAQDYQPDRRSHKLLNLGVLLLALFISAGILYGSDASHQLLRPYPTLEEVRSPEMVVDAYMQQLDAFEKGQLELDLDVNPALHELINPYDKGERDKNGVEYHWDRAYYNGKYYSYFGLAPLFMVYYPVFWLTGMLPTTIFAGACLTVFAILCIFAAIQGLMRLFTPKANLLLFLSGELAVMGGSLLWLMQASASSFYYLPLIASFGWLGAFTAFACYGYQAGKPWKRIVLFALCGLSVVMLVLSRPNAALLAIAFGAPLFLRILLDKNLSARQRFLESALPFLIPILMGAAGIMYYNAIRFGSVFEFGTSYQLTESDIRYNSVTPGLHHFGSMLYHYFAESFVYTEFFPFLRFTTEKCVDFGNYLYQEYSAGLLQMPLNLGIFLLIPAVFTRSSSSDRKELLKKQTGVLVLLAALALGYLDFMLGGIHIRYVCDLTLALSVLALFLILEQIHFDGTRSARILYVIVLCAILVTIGRGVLTIFSNETNDVLLKNPDFYLYVSRIFHS